MELYGISWGGWLGFGAWLVWDGLWDGRGQAPKPSLVGWILRLEFLALALCVGIVCLQRSKPKAQPKREGLRMKFFSLALCVGFACWKRSKKKAHPRGSAFTQSSKIPIAMDGFWEFKTTPVILHGSNYITKLKKNMYIYSLLLIILNYVYIIIFILLMFLNILCLQMYICIYKCNVSRETTTQSTNVTQKGEKKSQK